MRIAVSRAPGAERVVTPLELFFDLVYVFAIGQLSHHLLEHVDLRTAAETLIMTLAVVYAWYMTAWGANWLEPNRLAVRLLLVGLMFAACSCRSRSPTRSTSGRGFSSADTCSSRSGARRSSSSPCAAGRSASTSSTTRSGSWSSARSGSPARSRTATPVSRSGGSPSSPPTRARGPCTGSPAAGGGSTSSTPRSPPSTSSSASASSSSSPSARPCSRWAPRSPTSRSSSSACSRSRSASPGPSRCGGATSSARRRAASEDAGADGWWGTLPLTLIVLALIAVVVGDELAIAHPGDDATLGFTLLTFGGPALFLLAQLLFFHEAIGRAPRSRIMGVVALAILAVATAPLTLLAGIAASTAVLLAVAVADTVGST